MNRSVQISRNGSNVSKLASSVYAYIQQYAMLQDLTHLGVAVSGGADSVALLHLLHPICQNAGIKITVLHLDHGLRSDAVHDSSFVKTLAHEAHLDFYTEKATLTDDKIVKRSLEMRARKMRMDFFQACVKSLNLDAIATGHQADDVAETLLLRLMRGAGATGLSGLRPISENGYCRLLRPLLNISGAALRHWLRQNNYVWREDLSNSDSKIPRNRIRNTLIPKLEQDTPMIRLRLCQSAETLREDDIFLEELASQRLKVFTNVTQTGTVNLDMARVLHEHVALQRRILRQWLFQQGQNQSAGLDTVCKFIALCHTQRDWQRQLSNSTYAVCSSGFLSLRTVAQSPQIFDALEFKIAPPQTVLWGTLQFDIVMTQGIERAPQAILKYPAVCSLNAAMLNTALVQIRKRQPGDRIKPLGHKGTQKVQDVFVNQKVPAHLRDTIPLLICANEVIWIPGYRIDRSFAVPSADAPCLRIMVQPARQAQADI